MVEYVEYDEPQGCCNVPGFVKSNPKNNQSYLDKACEMFPKWADVMRDTDRKLEEVVPGYNIAQIKEKFWCLRFYIDVPDGVPEEVANEAFRITWEAEGKAKPLR